MQKREDIVIVQSVVRRHLIQKRYKTIRSREKQRQNILNEVLTTERKYNTQLRTIIEVFYTPLVHISKQQDSFLTEEDIKRIFNSIETVFSISTQLLQLLEERYGVDGWNPHKSVTDLFLQVIPYMKSLKGYFENFDDALAHLNRLRASSPLFARFVSTAEKHPSCLQLDLPALLIIPIQRMPRYEMLLASLTQHTPQDTRAWEEASRAATALQTINKQINEGMRVDSNQKEMIVLQNLIDMQTRLGMKYSVLLEPHRKLLRIGTVTMCSMRDFSMQKRLLYLCNDILITVTLFLNTGVKIDKVLPLISAQIVVNQKDSNGLSFFVISPVKSHLFFCESHANAVSWMTDIQLAIAHLVESNPENAKERNEWKLEAVNGHLKVVPEDSEKRIDPPARDPSEEFDEDSFVMLSPEERPPRISASRSNDVPLLSTLQLTPRTQSSHSNHSPRSSQTASPSQSPRPIQATYSVTTMDPTSSSPHPITHIFQPATPTRLLNPTNQATPPKQRAKSLPTTPERLGFAQFDPSCINHHVHEVNAAFLALHDGCTHLASDSTYILLPESAQFIMFMATGHIKFTNRGDADMLLRSHKRGCTHHVHVVGNSFTLAPRTSQAFDFKGKWFVEVSGNPSDLIVSDLALSGGNKGNKLGMAS